METAASALRILETPHDIEELAARRGERNLFAVLFRATPWWSSNELFARMQSAGATCDVDVAAIDLTNRPVLDALGLEPLQRRPGGLVLDGSRILDHVAGHVFLGKLENLCSWLRAVQRGTTWVELRRAACAANAEDVDAHLDVATVLISAHRFAEATPRCLALWTMMEPRQTAAVFRYAALMDTLVSKHPHARAEIASLIASKQAHHPELAAMLTKRIATTASTA